MLHLIVREILEAQEDDHQVGILQRLEPRDLRIARGDEAGLGIDREEHAALEAVPLREDPRQRRQRFLGSVLVIARKQDDVLARTWTLAPLVDDEMGVLGSRDRGSEQQDGGEQ